MPDAPISRARRVYRGVGIALAVGFGAAGLVLVVVGDSQRAMSIGIVLGLWGIAVGYVATMEPRRHHTRERVPAATEPADHAGVALADEDRERYEIQLEVMLRREIERVLRTELAELRGEVSVLRGELNEKFDGQLRLERIETTRVIGSDIQSLHEEVRRLSAAREQESAVPLWAQGIDFGSPRWLNGDVVASVSPAAPPPEAPASASALDTTPMVAPLRDPAGDSTPNLERDAVGPSEPAAEPRTYAPPTAFAPSEPAAEPRTYAPPTAFAPSESVSSSYSPAVRTPAAPPASPAFGSARFAAGTPDEPESSVELPEPMPTLTAEAKPAEPKPSGEPAVHEPFVASDDPFASLPRLGAFASPDLLLDTDPPAVYLRVSPPSHADVGRSESSTGRRRRAEGEENEVLNRIIGHS